MNRDNIVTHSYEEIGDYVLGLLPPRDEQRLKQHIANCDECREFVQLDRALAQAVRDTLIASSRPDPVRLRQLMPAAPRGLRATAGVMAWQRQFAAVALLLLVLLASFGLTVARRPSLWPGRHAGIYATAAIVDTPTLAATSTSVGVRPTETALPTPIAGRPLSGPYPAVVPIPIAPPHH